MATRQIKFGNQIMVRMRAENSDVKLHALAYDTYVTAPPPEA